MTGAFFNWCKQKVAICMSGAATPGWLPINEDNIITKVCEGVRMPNAESVLKTMQEHHSSFPSCQPQHFRRRGNCCYLSSTWEAIKFIEYFMDCQSSVRSRREAQDINVPNSVWDGCRHILRKTGSQKQQFALWVIAPEDLTSFFFLWRGRYCTRLGPYNCPSSENLRTEQKWTRMARKNGKSVQTKNKTHQKPKRPANPPARFAFRHKTTQRNNTKTGQGPTKNTQLRFAM